MKSEYRLSVVFCAVDETFSLIDTFEKISKYGYAFEYIFILSKNASSNCIDTVKKICKNPSCCYFIQDGYGLGNAIRNAIDLVSGTHMIVWPADDGMDTASFPKMAELSHNNPEKIVSVSRWLQKNGFEGYGRIRKMINFISQKIFAFLYSADLTDFTNPTQIVPVNIYRKIKWQGERFDFVPEMTFKPLKLGCEFIEVPCKSLKRQEGSSNCSFFEMVKYYYVIYKIYRMNKTDIVVGESK